MLVVDLKKSKIKGGNGEKSIYFATAMKKNKKTQSIYLLHLFLPAISMALCIIFGVYAESTYHISGAFSCPSVTVRVNGSTRTLHDARGQVTYPISVNDTTYLPSKAVGQMLGATVSWNAETQSICFETESVSVNTNIKIAYNGVQATLKDQTGNELHPITYNNSTYVPIRAVANLLGAKVDWNAKTETVIIYEENTNAKVNNTSSAIKTEKVQSASEKYIWPLPGALSDYTVTENYGTRICPFHGLESHNAIDISAAENTPIYATKSGTIYVSAFNSSLGNYITINHNDGTASQYCHMISPGLPAGTVVKRGDVIGYVGQTGDATGNHLHFAIFTGQPASSENAVDPLCYF